MTRHNITVSDADWQALRELGNGNASEGIRKALHAPKLDSDGLMAIAAFRYCLGRMTYIVPACAEWLEREWPRFPKRDRAVISRELSEAIEEDAQARADGKEYSPLGNDCDRAAWVKLAEFIEKDRAEH